MVTVVIVLEFLHGLFAAYAHPSGQNVQVLVHLGGHFLFRDAADGGVFRQHADVFNVVQFTEDAQLRELGDSRQEHEAQIRIAGFERAIKVAHDVAEDRQVLFFMRHVEQGGVVFVNEHHHLAARLFVCTMDKVCKACVRVRDFRLDAKFLFRSFQHP